MPTVRLPRLQANWQEQPQLLERYWDEAMTTIEKLLTQIISIPAIQEALNNLEQTIIDAQTAADNANQAAETAQQTTNTQAKESSLVQSYVSNYSNPLIEADSNGDITVADHTRVYGNITLNPSVAVEGATFSTTGLADDVVRIYYVDADRSGGVVTYEYTIDPEPPVAQSGDIHSVGAVVIPSVGNRPGREIRPPGYIEP